VWRSVKAPIVAIIVGQLSRAKASKILVSSTAAPTPVYMTVVVADIVVVTLTTMMVAIWQGHQTDLW